jgi:hypothetical protein
LKAVDYPNSLLSNAITKSSMIKYRYSLYTDLKAHLDMWRSLRWLKENNIHILYPNPWETLKLIFKQPKIDYQSDKNVTCYWVSAGNWGSYELPNEIWICPREINNKRIIEIIKHEIIHLEHEHV